jgi:Afadin- and alpha -actinin-Binding
MQLFTFFRFGSERTSKLSTPALADMEAHNLQAASTYVNNILLARGLLKSGHPIDFAQPDNEDGGSEATMARIINLVNDLVLRRDVSRSLFYTWRILSDIAAARIRAPREPSDHDSNSARKRV